MDWHVSVLGFGAMRLPVRDNDPTKINKAEATRMIHHAIDNGVNYLDTAYVYNGGKGEPFIGEALRDGYREKIKLATKLPPWIIHSSDDFENILNQQLKNLQTDHIDFYLLHGINRAHWKMFNNLDVLRWLEKIQKDGRVIHLGFSFHDTYELFEEVINAFDKWEFCQIQYNYMDTGFQAGTKGLKLAAGKGLGVVVMEPLRGGQLVNNLPDSVKTIWNNAPVQRSLYDWALQWVWDHPEVSTALSGMSAMDHVVGNLESADKAKAHAFSREEMKIVQEVTAEYYKSTPIPCTMCRYCIPCPEDVNIPEIFKLYVDLLRYNDEAGAKRLYNGLFGNQKADKCKECYECEGQCPQNIAIVDWLKKCHETLMAL